MRNDFTRALSKHYLVLLTRHSFPSVAVEYSLFGFLPKRNGHVVVVVVFVVNVVLVSLFPSL